MLIWKRKTLLLSLLLLGLWSYAKAGEVLQYRAAYKGVFSAGEDWVIADVKLTRRSLNLPGMGEVVEERMDVSSRAYPFIEKQFPFRVMFRNLLRADDERLLLIEKYKKTNRLRHELSWFGRDDGKVLRFRAKGKHAGLYTLPRNIQQWLGALADHLEFHKLAHHSWQPGLLGRLSLLSKLRQQALKNHAVYEYAVSDGEDLYRYRVKVLTVDALSVQGERRLAWKLKFEGFEADGKVAHDPLYVWLSMDQAKTPLLFEARHSYGRFVIRLHADPEADDPATSG